MLPCTHREAGIAVRESAIHARLPFSEHVPEKEEVYSNGRPESGEYGCDFTFIFFCNRPVNKFIPSRHLPAQN